MDADQMRAQAEADSLEEAKTQIGQDSGPVLTTEEPVPEIPKEEEEIPSEDVSEA